MTQSQLKFDQPPKRIGLVAGWGDFPIRVATSLKQQGHKVICLGIRDHASPKLASICDEFQFFGIGKMGAQVRFLKNAGVTQATMAGKIFKHLLFRRFHVLRHLPDLLTLRYFYGALVAGTNDCRDDTLLTTVTRLYSSQGIDFVPATDFAPQLLASSGNLTSTKPSPAQFRDIAYGWKIAKEMGRHDIGQSVVVRNQTVIAVEAIEGTDECIRRAGQLCQSGFVVVKVAKPQQDLRFDVPTIGQGTIQTIHQAGGKVLTIEADKTIILDESATLQLADRLGICIASFRDQELNLTDRDLAV